MKNLLLSICVILCCAGTVWAEDMDSCLSFRRFTTQDGLPQMQTETIFQDSKGYIYIGTLSGFVRYDGREFTPFLKGHRENIVCFAEPDDGVHALGFRRQWTLSENQLEQLWIDPEKQLLLNNFNSPDFPKNVLLMEDEREQNRGVYRMENRQLKLLFKNDVLDQMQPDRKAFMQGNRCLVPTPQGLYEVTVETPSATKLLTTKNDIYSFALLNGMVTVFASDGIYNLEGDSLRMSLDFPFPEADYGLFVRQDAQGTVYIADAHSLYVYDGRRVHRISSGFNLIKCLFVDSWDRIWLATYQGAYCFFHADFMNYRLTDTNDIVRAVAADNDGHMVCGTLNGKILVDGKAVSVMPDNYYQPSAAVVGNAVYLVGNGDVAKVEGSSVSWLKLPPEPYKFITKAGVRLIIGSRSQIYSYNTTDQTYDTLTTAIRQPWCAACDHEGTIWIGATEGLFSINAGKVMKKVDYPQKLTVTTMTSDCQGYVYFASADSLFTIRNGVVSEMNSQIPQLATHEIRSLYMSDKGFLIVATIDGLLVAKTDSSCRVMDVSWFDHLNGFTVMEPQQAMMAETPDGRVWLAGLEELCSFSPEALLESNRQSTVIQEPEQLKWWQRWWVLTLGILVIGAVSWSIARKIEKHRTKRAINQLKREKKQKELQLTAIRLKSIPHFHANVLAGIEYFVMNNSADNASKYLKMYSDFTNKTLADIDKPARTVAEELAYVENYMELEMLRYGERLRYEVDVDDDVDTNTLLPNMLLHTYCQNAVKHGIQNKPGGGTVKISIRRQQKGTTPYVAVAVEDDGVGREKAKEYAGNSSKLGLNILMQQIELFNQHNVNNISQTVTDLYDDRGMPAGTRFEMTVPVDYQYT